MSRKGLLTAAVMAVVAVIGYYASREMNPITGKTQSVGLSQQQEVVLGLQSAPQMAQEFGGPDPDASVQSDLEQIGRKLVRQGKVANTPYRFQFKVLRDEQTVNAFALPGGPVFITRALLERLENEAQLAGVLGHEVGHVVGRHSAEQIAKTQLGQGLVGAVGAATSDGESGGSPGAQQVAAFVLQMTLMKYGRTHELEADALGVQIMSEAGYDPRALINVMTMLAKASGGSQQPEFVSTHPDPGNRQERIRQQIATKFPEGVPRQLTLGRRITVPRASNTPLSGADIEKR
jgi:beta-barrel assembly-enhancing protease